MAKSSAAPAHTPIPWDYIESKTLIHIEARDEHAEHDGYPICSIPRRDVANAKFIVTACNAHQALYEALSALTEELEMARSLVAKFTPDAMGGLPAELRGLFSSNAQTARLRDAREAMKLAESANG